jgi:outer membrane protein insertion porin family
LPENTRTDVSLFLDFGNVWGVDYDSSIDESNELRSSTGVAASWSSPLGPMTFILSTNLSKASTDETESFNFNLGTTF